MLFTIDDRTYRAALEQAQANPARAKTQASLARSEANRTDKLVNTNVVSREEWEQRRSAATRAQADIRAAQAAVDAAQLNLDFTKVTAPIDGRASRALITSGNPVTAGDSASVLTTGLAENGLCLLRRGRVNLPSLSELARSGQRVSGDHAALPVEIGLTGEEGYPHQGKVDFWITSSRRVPERSACARCWITHSVSSRTDSLPACVCRAVRNLKPRLLTIRRC